MFFRLLFCVSAVVASGAGLLKTYLASSANLIRGANVGLLLHTVRFGARSPRCFDGMSRVSCATWLEPAQLAFVPMCMSPRVLGLLISPSRATKYSEPATAWQRLLGAALHPHTLLLACGRLLGQKQQQFVRDYLFLLLPAGAVGMVSLLSILNRVHMLKPLLAAAWSTRRVVLISACTGVSATNFAANAPCIIYAGVVHYP